ncbi:glucosamine-6-phosphate deaminase [Alkaliflexus imshenetskii]|uniref:glucosamine-6-phosphate deaminase n=1 Tax=Alkaliflexus imshenetskii TaxID=286730 RepID=UPI000478D9AF|nr:glucosamine-6-phosphate deaminase [Alkaliflexus imshenetskii]
MRLIIQDTYAQAASWIAQYVAHRINVHTKEKPFVLGLPTGSSPLGIYKELICLYREGKVSFNNVVTFNMDEYIGLHSSHPQSYHTFMHDNFFSSIDIRPENINIPNGLAEDVSEECLRYEEQIAKYGGIDLFLGGVGEDGHIAFNEPGSSFQSVTRVKTLTQPTVNANARFFDDKPGLVPKKAITVGVATIMQASEVVIMVNGHRKARALQQAVEGAVSHMWPITVLQMHPKGIIVCDEEAVSELRVGTYKYFKDIERVVN